MFKNSSVAPYCPSISTDPFEFFSELPNLVHTCLSYLKSCLSLLISITVRYEITHYSLKTPETLMPLCFLIRCSLSSLNIHPPCFSWPVESQLLMPSSNVFLSVKPSPSHELLTCVPTAVCTFLSLSICPIIL